MSHLCSQLTLKPSSNSRELFTSLSFFSLSDFVVSPREVRGQQREIQGRSSGGGREVIYWRVCSNPRLEDKLTNRAEETHQPLKQTSPHIQEPHRLNRSSKINCQQNNKRKQWSSRPSRRDARMKRSAAAINQTSCQRWHVDGCSQVLEETQKGEFMSLS